MSDKNDSETIKAQKNLNKESDSDKPDKSQSQESDAKRANDKPNSKTKRLYDQLHQDISLTEFLNENAQDFLAVPLCRYLKALIEKRGYTKAQVIRSSGINRRFFFDILADKRKPTRNYVLRILIALQIPLKNVQWLLRATGYAQLYSRDRRDSVIIYCINHNMGVNECNSMLKKVYFEEL